jgi:hypothetical protein
MEDSTFIQSDNHDSSQPQLTQKAIGYLVIAAKWGKFLAILGFITIAFILIAGLLMGLVFSLMKSQIASMGGASALISSKWVAIPYLIFGILGFLPVYFLNSFSNNITRSIRNNDSNAMTVAFKRLKNYFVFIGSYTIVLLAIYLIVIIVIASTALMAV